MGRMSAFRAVPEKALAGIAIALLGLFAVRGDAQPVVLLLGIGLVIYGYAARAQAQRQEMIDLLKEQRGEQGE
jgi:hypothetical protein